VSPDHPQHHSHRLQLQSEPVISVILGDGLPKWDGLLKHDEQFYQYMLLLFQPWHHFEDFIHPDKHWSVAFEHASFSCYCKELMANMVVDSECRDTKTEQSATFLVTGQQPDHQFVGPDDSSVNLDGVPLAVLLAEDESLNDAWALMDLTADDTEFNMCDIINTLTDDEAEVFQMAQQHCLRNDLGVETGDSGHGQSISFLVSSFIVR
jgi:hypothetical protein